jgi:hypothetical protein
MYFGKEVSSDPARRYALMVQADFGRSVLQVHGAQQVM